MPNRVLGEGAYELLVTEQIRDALEQARRQQLTVALERVDGALLATLLQRYVDEALARALVDGGVALATEVAARLGAEDCPVSPPQLLRAIHRGPTPPPVTSTPLSMSALLTGALDEPRLGLELEREIASSDHVDALVSFVTWEGWRRLQPALEALAQRGGRLRLITTTYTGATDAEAIAAIARLPGVEVRVSFDGRRTRLHAKAWLFHRHTGFSSAWVGSANLSGAALSSGLEWTMKASAVDLPHVLQKFSGTFETLWNEGEFEPYTTEDLPRLQAAIDRERGRATPSSNLHFFAALQPYPFQQEILDRLAAERALHQRRRNLVVAATGTGKTLIAAFDYLRQLGPDGLRPRLLFVAHREELLQQSLDAFRHVLRDASFGERLGGGFEPQSHDHLFTTVQSFASRRLADVQPPDFWDFVVVDECHHSTAETYSQVVDRLQPRLLLGLTATPERADGNDILPYFDGRIAAEVRLWHALDRQLLAPFDYYGISDGTPLSQVEWRRGAYDVAALSNLYTGNDARADLVLEAFRAHRGNLAEARALGFCVDVAHAEYMAKHFTRAGVPSAAVHGGSSPEERRELPARLQRGTLNVLFTCDLYNEGVDLPYVDTLLFLRPTSSPTVFLQQLGRGLRLHPGKSSCLVLDFIGQCRREFRFDRLLTALTGIPRGRLQDAMASDFPTLPAGCALRLDRVSREVIERNLKETLRGGARLLAQELREHAQRRGPGISLSQFLEDSGRPVEDVYDAGSFTELRVRAGLDSVALTEDEAALSRRLRLLLHTDDPEQLALWRRLDLSSPLRRRVLMLGYQLWHELDEVFVAEEVLARFDLVPRLRAELGELAELLAENVGLAPVAELPDGWTLQLHRAYQRREVLTAVGTWTEEAKPSIREGVLRVGADDEVFFVTLVKDHRFSPTTRYRDYAISRELFHWQSQTNTPEDGAVGHAYQRNTRRFWLFVRRTSDDPFHFLGRVRYVTHEGSRPMSITWRLDHPMPAALFQQYASLVAA